MAVFGFNDFLNSEQEDENEVDKIAEHIAPENDTVYESSLFTETHYTVGTLDTRVDVDELKFRQEQQKAQESFDDVFPQADLSPDKITEKDIVVTSDIDEKEQGKVDALCDDLHKITIDTYEWIVELENEATDLINKVCDQKTPRRTYTNETVYPKANFSKPRTEQSTGKTLKLLALAGGVLGIFLGTQGNNYYEYANGKVDSGVSCVLNSLIIEDLPMASSFNSSVFMTGLVMGLLIVAAIYGIILLQTSQNKAFRVGHEHGSAHLAKDNDYNTFKKKFMER